MLKFKTGRLTDLQYQPYYRRFQIEDNQRKQKDLVGRILLAKLMDLPEDALLDDDEFTTIANGKPLFAKRTTAFNISHSADLVLVAISDRPLGVDVEKVKPVQLKRLKRAFTVAELAYLEKLPAARQSLTMLRLWTVKEAVLKETGAGLPGKPWTVSVNVPRMDVAEQHGQRFAINFLAIHEDYLGTMAQKIE
ncbi:4'-phosphopantetheinyl transferase superfamily protein [Fructilactobacillus cliffordii]|uniref:4'-phosphopantetheinyl transferase family protein n=1 Tax=Fructilactobacillus cliffordii TaxID=2940299 RepID=UPI0020935306|nr:4'-phosphopantetheinyl transferase superfamily protein [Fructilactobacillus cliffordii]USS87159.1 4'-phosphopantetheinyl transferase superfamily protein [Fructilactobacillus cliffordii]